MAAFQLAALFLALVAGVAWVKAKWMRLPPGAAMFMAGLIGASALAAVERAAPGATFAHPFIVAMNQLNFADTVVGQMLAFLLFSGAMQVDLSELRRTRAAVWSLATLGVVASTAVVGFAAWVIAGKLGLPLTLPWALVFGALISPTDPVAVIATVRRGRLSPRIVAILQGEALLNDAVGIMVFLAALAFAVQGEAHSFGAVGRVMLSGAGGFLFGLATAYMVVQAMRRVRGAEVKAILSLALAMGVYAGAQALGLSGPMASVAAGFLVGGAVEGPMVSAATRAQLRSLWGLIDELLNAVLFLIMGLEVMVLPFEPRFAGLAAAVIPLVLVVRLAIVAPWGAYYHLRESDPGATQLLAWGGLRGGLSLALALGTPEGPQRAALISLTYAVVAFSVVVQGLSFGPLADKLRQAPATET